MSSTELSDRVEIFACLSFVGCVFQKLFQFVQTFSKSDNGNVKIQELSATETMLLDGEEDGTVNRSVFHKWFQEHLPHFLNWLHLANDHYDGR